MKAYSKTVVASAIIIAGTIVTAETGNAQNNNSEASAEQELTELFDQATQAQLAEEMLAEALERPPAVIVDKSKEEDIIIIESVNPADQIADTPTNYNSDKFQQIDPAPEQDIANQNGSPIIIDLIPEITPPASNPNAEPSLNVEEELYSELEQSPEVELPAEVEPNVEEELYTEIEATPEVELPVEVEPVVEEELYTEIEATPEVELPAEIEPIVEEELYTETDSQEDIAQHEQVVASTNKDVTYFRSEACPNKFFEVKLPNNGKFCQIFAADLPAALVFHVPQSPNEVLDFYQQDSATYGASKEVKKRFLMQSYDKNTTIIISADGKGTQVDVLVKESNS